MIAIDNVLLSNQVIEEKFVCDLAKCKGACCVDGDAGAPLEEEELKMIDKVFDKVKPYLNKKSIAEIESQGRYVHNEEFGWVTPAIGGAICVYGITDEQGVVKCGIEQAFNDGKINWKKPISCHLFPLIVSKSKRGNTLYVNYEPRDTHCKAACTLGRKLKVPVYEFLKEPLIRRFGNEFYRAVEATAKHVEKAK